MDAAATSEAVGGSGDREQAERNNPNIAMAHTDFIVSPLCLEHREQVSYSDGFDLLISVVFLFGIKNGFVLFDFRTRSETLS
jgi:hypothetical protein